MSHSQENVNAEQVFLKHFCKQKNGPVVALHTENLPPFNNDKAALTSFELGMDDFRTVRKPALSVNNSEF